MEKKKQFVKPAVLEELILHLDRPILDGSVVDNATIISTGQEVETHDFTGNDFDFQWE